MSPKILKGDGTWGWVVNVEGDDLVIRNAKVTCFGGLEDKVDKVNGGNTASGVSTVPDDTMGCALPRCYTGDEPSLIKALGGSPIPHNLPFHIPVEFTWNGVTITVPFIDIGPAKRAKDQGDLTRAAARHFKPSATTNNFEITGATIRIKGGAKYAA